MLGRHWIHASNRIRKELNGGGIHVERRDNDIWSPLFYFIHYLAEDTRGFAAIRRVPGHANGDVRFRAGTYGDFYEIQWNFQEGSYRVLQGNQEDFAGSVKETYPESAEMDAEFAKLSDFVFGLVEFDI